ncbi:MAG: bifunctional adenosylcobinamide kinase/adenosylcobinamide-phosphate guanylyltransferase [Lachnospiraceae bacterium]|nr:bifunctional adenosylcobinamide kinase/adenosylcobinamide-phosphate guanylyltransferase [Lachnospiraceae bacterium]
MILVTGGAFQGKLEFAQKTYGFTDGWIDGRNCGFAEIRECRGIHHFHEYVRRMTGTGENAFLPDEENDAETCAQVPWNFENEDLTALENQADLFAAWLIKENPKLVIVSNELGYGVVPMEKQDRLWREAAGRICTCLAARADEVVRVVCGIGMRLK